MKKYISLLAVSGVLAGTELDLAAASAVAYCSSSGVYAYSYNCADLREAEGRALASARKRGAAAPAIITSSAEPGYGAISFWRPAGQGIHAIGAVCGASTAEQALLGAQKECRARGGRGPAPRVAWHDTTKAAAK